MHCNTLFQDINLKNFLGRGIALIVVFGAPHLALSAFGFMRPVFSVPIVSNPKCD